MKRFKNKLVELDKIRAKKIAKLISPLRFAHPGVFSPQKINQESDLFLLYILVGICHQMNWNFLISALDKVRTQTLSKFTPEYLAKITHRELASWLSAYPRKERLDKKMRRVELVQDMSRFLLERYEGEVLNLARKSAGKMGGKKGMYALLEETIAYGEDPLKKKATVFIDLADELGLIEFSDWNNYLPPIDYHIARILLRTGVVKVFNKTLLSSLMRSHPATKKEDLAIRQACIDAIVFLSGKESKMRKKIQGMLWAIGRDCCYEEQPNCESCQLKDCECQKYITNDCKRGCFLKEACLAFKENKSFLKLREQNFISTWY